MVPKKYFFSLNSNFQRIFSEIFEFPGKNFKAIKLPKNSQIKYIDTFIFPIEKLKYINTSFNKTMTKHTFRSDTKFLKFIEIVVSVKIVTILSMLSKTKKFKLLGLRKFGSIIFFLVLLLWLGL